MFYSPCSATIGSSESAVLWAGCRRYGVEAGSFGGNSRIKMRHSDPVGQDYYAFCLYFCCFLGWKMRRVPEVVQVDIDWGCLMDFHLSHNAIRVTVCDDCPLVHYTVTLLAPNAMMRFQLGKSRI
jgi:hypothetical protein